MTCYCSQRLGACSFLRATHNLTTYLLISPNPVSIGGVANSVALLVSTASNESWDDVTATSLGVSPETKVAWDDCDAPIGAASGLRGW